MTQQHQSEPLPGPFDAHPVAGSRHPGRVDVWKDLAAIVGTWVATVLAYLAPPVGALLWAGLGITGAVVVLVQDRPGRVPAIAALVFAVIAVLWTLVRMGALS
jgi:hypothetical protein